MTEQPSPQPGRETVWWEARERIYDALSHQYSKGMATYGTELRTFNGRSAAADWIQEHADALQYGVQLAMEYEYVLSLLEDAVVMLEDVYAGGDTDWKGEQWDAVGKLIKDMRQCITPNASAPSESNQPAASTSSD